MRVHHPQEDPTKKLYALKVRAGAGHGGDTRARYGWQSRAVRKLESSEPMDESHAGSRYNEYMTGKSAR